MGSFSVCCAMSKLTIKEGDKIKLIPLFPSKNAPSVSLQMDDRFHPLTLPVTGIYDDYGRIGEIEEDANTKILEEYFNMSIENIMDIVTDENTSPYKSVQKNSLLTVDYRTLSSHDLLKKMGYHENGFICTGSCFSTPYGEIKELGNDKFEIFFSAPIPESKKLDLKEIMENLDICYETNQSLLNLHHLMTGEWVLLKNSENAELLLNSKPMFVLDAFYQEFSKSSELKSIISSTKIEIERVFELHNKMKEIMSKIGKELPFLVYSLTQNNLLFPFKNSEAIERWYWEPLQTENPEFFEALGKFSIFARNMYRTNTEFAPAFQGTQFGEPEIELKLHRLASKILRNRIKK